MEKKNGEEHAQQAAVEEEPSQTWAGKIHGYGKSATFLIKDVKFKDGFLSGNGNDSKQEE